VFDLGMDVARVARWLGPALFLAFLGVELAQGRGPSPALRVGGLGLWMAVWWMGEAVALHVTALLPLVLLPLLGIAKADVVAASYGHDLVWLFLGAFLLAAAVEQRGLHRRLALGVLARVGPAPRRLVLGFLVAAATVSAVLSNTATAAMLMPVAVAVARRGEEGSLVHAPRVGAALVLAVAYGASIGGILTVIGTPPNGIFVKQAREAGLDERLNFASYALAALPIALLQLGVAWLVLTRGLPGRAPGGTRATEREALGALGRMGPAEKRTLGVFGVAILLWATRAEMAFDAFTFPGWAKALGMPWASDATVAIAAAIVLMLLPSGEGDGPVLAPGRIQTIAWDLLLLFGGGFALGDAFRTSGLADQVGQGLGGLAALPAPVLLLVVALTVTALSEVATNTPLAVAVLPVLAAASKAAGISALPVLLAATFAASLGFMLPVGTAPNAIAFATGRAPVRTMLRTGFWIDLAGAVVIALVVWLWSAPLLAPR
jgi:solute carrier family 13 (sodium-dependent dicarboxylate transporter), member 2/3/5